MNTSNRPANRPVAGQAPRYRQVAQILRAAIGNGTYKVGELLPGEIELCALHDISRHTARDALRLLTQEGLVVRRRRAGTVVTARPGPAMFVQPLGGFQDLLQYAGEARLKIIYYGVAPADGLAATLNLAPEDWRELRGYRGSGAQTVGLARMLIRKDCAPTATEIDNASSVAGAIEARFGVVADRVDQRISAMTLTPLLAQLLGAPPGDAALHTQRQYRDAPGRLFLATETVHPAGRFAYVTSYTRERTDVG
ncbi:GntR family transcriptional regulator [Nitrospirillum sp. BR 11752]|uniref:GntR family transcriptional regulator n=1 Tax=Nitrospirillum sp. BR 11752 TaxID=3104293 RepID=UPI002EBA8F8A|nr:GntR family transcriptional regulator [Nitrospirillum sp. BR 11752]